MTPEIDGGRFPIKRTAGENVGVEADIFADGHDVLAAVVQYRMAGKRTWAEASLDHLVNDRWRGEFTVTEVGRYQYTLEAWPDAYASWRRDLVKRIDAGQNVAVELLEGARLIEEASGRATRTDARKLDGWARKLGDSSSQATQIELALSANVTAVMARNPDRSLSTKYGRELEVVVDRDRARFSTWYEMFPRSASSQPGRHGTFADCEKRLPYIKEMGFDVLYFPPVHPIGRTHRKGKNNASKADRSDPGSPWAIGAEAGGHKAIEPKLGTLEQFRHLVETAGEQGIEIAIDLAFQCSPDHPYVEEHPSWFRWRPDGTLRYAENPPKKYEDIYPLHFETDDWEALWEELRSVVLHWIDQGVRIFRVDNPHTKPFRFWEWLITSVKADHPDVIFLAEAFTRPKVMYDLAKAGFSQSYTYFAWRNARWELDQYLTELTQTEVGEYFRANLWPNTPDILSEYLQSSGRPGFLIRLVLAATLGANYGIYGPAYELCEGEPREPGSEEYLNSEKFELRSWDLDQPHSLRDFIARVNGIRRDNAALQSDRSLRFHHVDNEQIVCYSKQTDDREIAIVTVVNLDPHHTQSGWVSFDLDALGIEADQPYQAHDLLGDARYLWNGAHNYVELNPHVLPAHIFRIRRRVRSERDFDYFM